MGCSVSNENVDDDFNGDELDGMDGLEGLGQFPAVLGRVFLIVVGLLLIVVALGIALDKLFS